MTGTAAHFTKWTALITALATLMWPIIVVAALLAFRQPALRAIEQVTQSGGTVEVFGVKVNVGKATEEQQALILDLQKQVHKHLPAGGATGSGSTRPSAAGHGLADRGLADRGPVAPALRTNPLFLWVDDMPDNNLVLVASLRQSGFVIVQEESTEAALQPVAPGDFEAVVSDMGRGSNRTAGIDLIHAARQFDAKIPILTFCSRRAATGYREQALAAGANAISESATIIMQELRCLQATS
jgi:CheY-like chemotaxis protein